MIYKMVTKNLNLKYMYIIYFRQYEIHAETKPILVRSLPSSTRSEVNSSLVMY